MVLLKNSSGFKIRKICNLKYQYFNQGEGDIKETLKNHFRRGFYIKNHLIRIIVGTRDCPSFT